MTERRSLLKTFAQRKREEADSPLLKDLTDFGRQVVSVSQSTVFNSKWWEKELGIQGQEHEEHRGESSCLDDFVVVFEPRGDDEQRQHLRLCDFEPVGEEAHKARYEIQRQRYKKRQYTDDLYRGRGTIPSAATESRTRYLHADIYNHDFPDRGPQLIPGTKKKRKQAANKRRGRASGDSSFVSDTTSVISSSMYSEATSDASESSFTD